MQFLRPPPESFQIQPFKLQQLVGLLPTRPLHLPLTTGCIENKHQKDTLQFSANAR